LDGCLFSLSFLIGIINKLPPFIKPVKFKFSAIITTSRSQKVWLRPIIFHGLHASNWVRFFSSLLFVQLALRESTRCSLWSCSCRSCQLWRIVSSHFSLYRGCRWLLILLLWWLLAALCSLWSLHLGLFLMWLCKIWFMSCHLWGCCRSLHS